MELEREPVLAGYMAHGPLNSERGERIDWRLDLRRRGRQPRAPAEWRIVCAISAPVLMFDRCAMTLMRAKADPTPPIFEQGDNIELDQRPTARGLSVFVVGHALSISVALIDIRQRALY
jgi:hypothetical protein